MFVCEYACVVCVRGCGHVRIVVASVWMGETLRVHSCVCTSVAIEERGFFIFLLSPHPRGGIGVGGQC